MDLNKRIEEAFAKAMEDGTRESLEAYKNLCDLRDLQEGQKVVKPLDEGKKEELTETQKFVRALRDQLGSMPTGSTIKVPLEVAQQIEKKRYEFSNLRRYVTVHNVGGDYAIHVEGTGVTVDYVSSGAAVGDGTPTLDAVTLTAYKFGALVKIDNELLADLEADIVNYITTMVAKGIALKEDHEILKGTGTSNNHITGVVTSLAAEAGTPRVKICATADTVTWPEVKAAIQKLNGGYRARAIAVMSQGLADAIHEFKDNGKYIFDQNQPLERILGIPVVISPDLAGTESEASTGANQPMMVVGDFSYYHVADRKGMTLVRLNETFAANDQTGFRAIERLDGKPTLTEAFAVLYNKKKS